MPNLIELYSIGYHLPVSKISEVVSCMILLVDYAPVKIYLPSQRYITSNHSLQLYVHNVADIILFLAVLCTVNPSVTQITFWWTYCDA